MIILWTKTSFFFQKFLSLSSWSAFYFDDPKQEKLSRILSNFCISMSFFHLKFILALLFPTTFFNDILDFRSKINLPSRWNDSDHQGFNVLHQAYEWDLTINETVIKITDHCSSSKYTINHSVWMFYVTSCWKSSLQY